MDDLGPIPGRHSALALLGWVYFLIVNGFIFCLQVDGKTRLLHRFSVRLQCHFCSTNLDFAGLSKLSLYNLSYTFVMCWKSGTLSFWMGPGGHIKQKVSTQ